MSLAQLKALSAKCYAVPPLEISPLGLAQLSSPDELRQSTQSVMDSVTPMDLHSAVAANNPLILYLHDHHA